MNLLRLFSFLHGVDKLEEIAYDMKCHRSHQMHRYYSMTLVQSINRLTHIFSELALIYKKPRAASVIASTDVSCAGK